jgi:hypothetical protein
VLHRERLAKEIRRIMFTTKFVLRGSPISIIHQTESDNGSNGEEMMPMLFLFLYKFGMKIGRTIAKGMFCGQQQL